MFPTTLQNKAPSRCFLEQGRCLTCEGRDDAAEFADIRSAMMILMFSPEEIWEILKVLSALLHLGNIKYKGKHASDMRRGVVGV